MIPRSRITAMNLAYMFMSFDTFLADMEEMGFTQLELWGGAPHFYPDFMRAQEIEETLRKIHDHGPLDQKTGRVHPDVGFGELRGGIFGVKQQMDKPVVVR